jgi:zinc transport system substrate-binding protein
MNMAKPLAKTMAPDQILALDQVQGLTLYHQRTGNLFGKAGCAHCCSDESDHDHHAHDHDDHEHQDDPVYDDEPINETKHGPIDGHFWLDIDNAKLCARAIADVIIKKWPNHKDTITANLAKLEADLDALQSQLKRDLAPIKDTTALIDHDSLLYLEKQFGFVIKGVLSSSEGHESSAIHLNDIKNELGETLDEGLENVFFYESSGANTTPPQLKNLASAYAMRLIPLDYVGEQLPKGTDLYQTCLRAIAAQLKAGFKPDLSDGN